MKERVRVPCTTDPFALLLKNRSEPPGLMSPANGYRGSALGRGWRASCSSPGLGEALEQPGGELHTAFLRYANENGDSKVANNVFAEHLKQRDFRKGTGRKRRTWLGIQLSGAAIEHLEKSRGGWPPVRQRA